MSNADLPIQFLALPEDRRQRMTAADIPEEFRVTQADILGSLHSTYGADRGMRFSKSICPDGFNFFIDVTAHAAKLGRQIQYLEIGSFEGVSMTVVGSLLRKRNILGMPGLTSIDPYYPDGYVEHHPVSGPVKSTSSEPTMAKARALYRALDLEVEHIRAESEPALRNMLIAAQSFDMIYIDGMHQGLTPTIDFALSMCLLARDGILVLDDWAWPDIIGLKQVCDRSMQRIAECPDIAAYVRRRA